MLICQNNYLGLRDFVYRKLFVIKKRENLKNTGEEKDFFIENDALGV